MIAVDTNLLVYAHRQDSPFFARATSALEQLVHDEAEWAVPWPCIHEFLATVTRRRITPNPTPVETALAQVTALLEIPNLRTLSEGPTHLATLTTIVTSAGFTGGAIHDARIAAICLDHGVRELWTADRDFARIPRLRTRNPLD